MYIALAFRRAALVAAVAFGATGVVAQTDSSSGAQKYPQKLIKIIVPYSPGSGPDLLARVLTERLAPRLGQTLVVESKPGAGGLIGTAAAATAPADGYTLLIAPPTHVIGSVLRKTPYDPIKDFEPVAQIARGGFVLVTNTATPAKNFEEFLAYLKAQGDNATYSSAGVGSTLHLYTAQFQLDFGTQMRHVPSKGSPGAVMDVLQNNVTMVLAPLELAAPLLKGGRLKALVQTGNTRSAVLPNIPTFAEAGFPGYNVDLWYGVFVPAGTPKLIVTKLNKEINSVMEGAEVKQQLMLHGLEPVIAAPEQLGSLIKSDFARWSAVVKRTGITAE